MSACAAPTGSPCRTGKGKVAAQYQTARFRLVPHLTKVLAVATPAVRKPGSAWTELPRAAGRDAGPAGHVRIGSPTTTCAASPRCSGPTWHGTFELDLDKRLDYDRGACS